MVLQSLREAAEVSKAWPFEEARKLIARIERTGQSEVMFETGYGPSGLPHIGTFGEVARTTMVRHAFRVLTGDAIKTRLIAFSDDMDGLRKAPDNIPNRELVAAHLGKPLTEVPDPFGEYRQLRRPQQRPAARFPRPASASTTNSLSSTAYYKSGPLRRGAAADAGALRRDPGDHAAFAARGARGDLFAVPADPSAHRHRHAGAADRASTRRRARSAGAIPDTSEEFETPVTGGHCKLQWKPDWAMRWYALGVDYEMAGKDLIDSVKLSSRIVRALGGRAAGRLQLRAVPRREGPEDLEVEGQRPHHRGMADLREPGEPVAVHVPEADGGQAALFRRHPAHRRRLSRLPRRLSAPGMEGAARQSGLAHPFRRAAGARDARATARCGRRRSRSPCCSTSRRSPTATIPRCSGAFCAAMRRALRRRTIRASTGSSRYAVAYFRDFVAPKKRYRAADEVEREALEAVSAKLARAACGRQRRGDPARALRHRAADPALSGSKAKGATPERPGVSNEFFNMVYAVLLGEERGPRLGSFIALYGLEETRALIARALAGELVEAD